MIRRGGHQTDEGMNTGDIDNPSKITYQNLATGMLKPIFDKMKMSKAVLIEIERSCLGDDSDPVILYDII